jgi:hypothetical protein
MIDLAPGQAIAVNWPAERYHADTECTSRSHLVELITRPSLYYATREARLLPPPPPTKALILGTDLHMAVLEPQLWPARARQLKPKDAAQIMCMASSVRSHPMVQTLFCYPHVLEQTILWRTEPIVFEVEINGKIETREESLLVRIRADALFDLGDTIFAPDLKSTEAPDPVSFARSCAKFRYHFQAAMYRDAIAALYPDREIVFLLVAVAKSAPFECAVYDLTDDALERGRNQYRAAMIELLQRRATGNWIADWQRSVHTLELPRWA